MSKRLRRVGRIGLLLATTNLILWFGAPAIRSMVDAFHDRVVHPERPYICYGVQEALVYMDPWYAWGVMFAVWIIGFALAPRLLRPEPLQDAATQDQHTIGFYTRMTLTLFAVMQSVYLFLLTVGLTMRGPQWAFYWPSEKWDSRDATPHNINLSEFFWNDWLGKQLPDNQWLREVPGLILLGVYFVAGWFVARRLSKVHSSMSGWKWTLYVFFFQTAGLLPLKMLLRWTVKLRYVVELSLLNV